MNAISHKFPKRRGSGAITVDAKPDRHLDIDELRELVPTLFKTDAHSSRSQRFQVIETHELLERLAAENFVPVQVQTGGSRSKDKLAYTKHLIRLRQRDVIGRAPAVGDSHPEIILTNAHDGTASYGLRAGLYRLVCANGLVVARENWGQVRVSHHGSGVMDKVIEGTYTVLDNARQAIGHASQMRAIPMSRADEIEFGERALALRWPGDDRPHISGSMVSRPRRYADVDDDGSNLWLTLNKVQENLIRGGLGYYHRNEETNAISRRHSRPINGVDGNIQLNRALWDLACDWAAEAGQPIAA